MICPYCNSKILYQLKTGQLKCSACRKKFSPKRIQRDMLIIDTFCKNLTANECSKMLHLNYITVKNRYEDFRKLIAQYLENKYLGKEVLEYDEYIYLEKNKKKIEANIFDAQNFLTFHFDNQVYNLPLTDLSQYKKEFLSDGLDKAYFKEFSKSMMLNKITKIQKLDNLITKFWIYFEKEILKYKGIKRENFFYYLKEIEFKFNYTKDEQTKILKKLYM
jgi:DNA-directed RNA polymerase subunit RPC12/RpoP/transposase-like protein